jgi:hypothetical protein
LTHVRTYAGWVYVTFVRRHHALHRPLAGLDPLPSGSGHGGLEDGHLCQHSDAGAQMESTADRYRLDPGATRCQESGIEGYWSMLIRRGPGSQDRVLELARNCWDLGELVAGVRRIDLSGVPALQLIGWMVVQGFSGRCDPCQPYNGEQTPQPGPRSGPSFVCGGFWRRDPPTRLRQRPGARGRLSLPPVETPMETNRAGKWKGRPLRASLSSFYSLGS